MSRHKFFSSFVCWSVETISLIFRTPLHHLDSANGHADVVRHLAGKSCQLNLAEDLERAPLVEVSGLCSDLVMELIDNALQERCLAGFLIQKGHRNMHIVISMA